MLAEQRALAHADAMVMKSVRQNLRTRESKTSRQSWTYISGFLIAEIQPRPTSFLWNLII